MRPLDSHQLQRRTEAPLLDRELVHSRLFVGGTLAATVAAFVLMGLLFTVPFYLQTVRGESAFDTGLTLMPLMIALILGSGVGPILDRRLGLRAPVALGLLVSAAGFVVVLQVSVTSPPSTLVLALSVIGFGFGTATPAAVNAVLGVLPPGREGAGTGLNQAVKQLGGVFAIAILGSLVAATYRASLTTATAALPAPVAEVARDSVAGAAAVAERLGGTAGPALRSAADTAYVAGMHSAAMVCIGVAVVAALGLAVLLPGRGREANGSAEATGEATGATSAEATGGTSVEQAHVTA